MILEIGTSATFRGIVRGSQTNSDSLGLLPGQPDQSAQEDVILSALRVAGVLGSHVMHTEMHGMLVQ